MPSNIVLVGMPASGKSTIGTLVANVLKDYSLYDTDSIIERTEGKSISKIFEEFSEDYFRKLEHDTIKMVCFGSKKIISVGGGAFENPDNRATLLRFGKVFYLKSDLDMLYYRISVDDSRPLLQQKDPKQVLKNLLKKREDNYKKAHYTVDTSIMNEDEIVRFIVDEASSES